MKLVLMMSRFPMVKLKSTLSQRVWRPKCLIPEDYELVLMISKAICIHTDNYPHTYHNYHKHKIVAVADWWKERLMICYNGLLIPHKHFKV